VSPLGLLGEKTILAAVCAAALTLLMSAGISAFVHLQWGRVELWLLALAAGAAAFGALGVGLGALAREVSVASLLVVLVALPIAFVALVPADAVSSGVRGVLDVVAFVFPFRAALQALGNAFSGTQPGIVGPLVHLVALTALFLGLARLALLRFAER
jgi:ABC-2 type transport system permease protein